VANQGAICNPSAELPIQSTEDNGGYFTHIKDIPEKLIHELCMLLDEERVLDGQDYKMFASELKLEPTRNSRGLHLSEERYLERFSCLKFIIRFFILLGITVM